MRSNKTRCFGSTGLPQFVGRRHRSRPILGCPACKPIDSRRTKRARPHRPGKTSPLEPEKQSAPIAQPSPNERRAPIGERETNGPRDGWCESFLAPYILLNDPSRERSAVQNEPCTVSPSAKGIGCQGLSLQNLPEPPDAQTIRKPSIYRHPQIRRVWHIL